MTSAIPRPGKIIGVGRNYLDHSFERGGSGPPAIPILFLKPPSAVIGDGDDIVLPAGAGRIDYEGELVAVVGQRLRRATPEQALAGVAGYTCGNDVTARDVQDAEPQWARAKGFDTFAAMGPKLASGLDPSGLQIVTRVNGEIRQSGSTADLLRPVGELLSYISCCMTLEPGDAVFTGTPAGIGPLSDGDVVEVEISGIGILRNVARAER